MIGKLQDSSRQSTERVAVKDVRLVYRACSTGFARALGLESPDLVIGRTDFDLLPREIARQQLVIESEVVNRAQTDITSLTLATAQHTQTVMRTPILSADQEVRGLDVRLDREHPAIAHQDRELPDLQTGSECALPSACAVLLQVSGKLCRSAHD